MATSTPRSATRMPSFRLNFPSAATPACRWKRAAPSRATTRDAIFWRCTAPPKCRTGTAIPIARMLGRKRESVQLFEGHVGGGFGIRGELYPEDVLVCAAALKFAQTDQMDRGPARASDRRQSFAPADPQCTRRHRREGRHPRRSTTNSSTTTAPICARTPPPCPISPPRCCRALIACRPIGRAGHIRLTNKTPCGTYRAPGRYETTFVRERLIDAIAAKSRHR